MKGQYRVSTTVTRAPNHSRPRLRSPVIWERHQNQGGSKVPKVQDLRVLFHQRALPTVLEVDTVRVKVAFRRDNHDLRHRPGDHNTVE